MLRWLNIISGNITAVISCSTFFLVKHYNISVVIIALNKLWCWIPIFICSSSVVPTWGRPLRTCSYSEVFHNTSFLLCQFIRRETKKLSIIIFWWQSSLKFKPEYKAGLPIKPEWLLIDKKPTLLSGWYKCCEFTSYMIQFYGRNINTLHVLFSYCYFCPSRIQ